MAQEPLDPVTPSRNPAQGEDTSAIKRDIERTRHEMSDTIGQIQDRLRPDHLLHQAKENVKEAVTEAATEKVRNIMSSAGETAQTVATRARGAGDQMAEYAVAHPLRIAFTVGAFTWWMLRNRDRSIAWEGASDTDWEDDGEYTYGERRTLRDKVGNYASNARDTVGSYAATARDTVGEYASTARETVGEYASSARQTAGEYAESARVGAQRASQRVRSAAGTATTSVDDWVSENPLAAGFIAAAVGAAIGLSVPRSELEDRAMGETRDAAWQRASSVATNIKETVSTKVMDAAEK
ncbi:MAG TPA: DUF3618 domain-containing protein, partial [Vicinamibacterales bacterium]